MAGGASDSCDEVVEVAGTDGLEVVLLDADSSSGDDSDGEAAATSARAACDVALAKGGGAALVASPKTPSRSSRGSKATTEKPAGAPAVPAQSPAASREAEAKSPEAAEELAAVTEQSEVRPFLALEEEATEELHRAAALADGEAAGRPPPPAEPLPDLRGLEELAAAEAPKQTEAQPQLAEEATTAAAALPGFGSGVPRTIPPPPEALPASPPPASPPDPSAGYALLEEASPYIEETGSFACNPDLTMSDEALAMALQAEEESLAQERDLASRAPAPTPPGPPARTQEPKPDLLASMTAAVRSVEAGEPMRRPPAVPQAQGEESKAPRLPIAGNGPPEFIPLPASMPSDQSSPRSKIWCCLRRRREP